MQVLESSKEQRCLRLPIESGTSLRLTKQNKTKIRHARTYTWRTTHITNSHNANNHKQIPFSYTTLFFLYYIVFSIFSCSLLLDWKLKTLLRWLLNHVPESKDGYSLLLVLGEMFEAEECLKTLCSFFCIFILKSLIWLG